MKISLIKGTDGFSAKYRDMTLSSAFQSIYNTDTGRVYGVEVLLRILDRNSCNINPASVFFTEELSRIEKVRLDLISIVLHVLNYHFYKNSLNAHFFLNVTPDTLVYLSRHKRAWDVLIKLCAKFKLSHGEFDFSNLWVEITESPSFFGTRELEIGVDFLRSLNFPIVIDDFGSECSDRKRVVALKPSIIKLDRSFLVKSRDGDLKPLIDAVAFARGVGAQIVLEGIESQCDLRCAQSLHIEYSQGYFLGIPTKTPSFISINEKINWLSNV